VAKGHSKDAVFRLGGVDITSVTGVTLSVDGQVADITTLNDDYKAYVRGQVDATLSVEGVYDDPEVGGSILAYAEGTAIPWIYYPQGTAAGKRRFSGTGLVTTHDIPAAMDAAVTYSFNVQNSGTISSGTA
jgi:hypothetical protein